MWAKFLAVDLHTHTPASADVEKSTYGASTPEAVVEAAIRAGLDAIAVTDHNTSAWCDRISEAAKEQPLEVLPGVEISTTEGHLLAIYDAGTPSTSIDEMLVRLGIRGSDQGKLDIAAEVGFAEAAKEIVESGGLAIAAHADKKRGVLKIDVAAHLKRTLLDEHLSGVEIVRSSAAKDVQGKIGNKRTLACVRGSDMSISGKSGHRLAGIGSRRTWIKAARPDLTGLRHALSDPDLRVILEEPEPPQSSGN